MSTAFALDYEGYTIEDATQSIIIADMIKKGKMVSSLTISLVQFQVVMKFTPPSKRQEKLKEQGLEMFQRYQVSLA